MYCTLRLGIYSHRDIIKNVNLRLIKRKSPLSILRRIEYGVVHTVMYRGRVRTMTEKAGLHTVTLSAHLVVYIVSLSSVVPTARDLHTQYL